MRALHLITTTLEEANGTATAVLGMCDSLSAIGVDVRIGSLKVGPPGRQPPYLHSFPVVPGTRRLGVSPAMRSWIAREVADGKASVIHSHGLWRMPMLYAALALRGKAAKLVCSPHGAMSPWVLAHNRWQKRLFSPLQIGALRQVSCFFATSEAECENIRRMGFAQPVCILRHGVELPRLQRSPGPRRKLLYLGRIDDLKGVDLLLPAWAAVERDFPDWDLEIVGPGPRSLLQRLRRDAGRLDLRRASFAGPLFGDAKWAAYQSADLFVLPSRSESFGLTVAEALAAGTPVIVTRRAPWSGLETEGAGWWIEPGVEALAAALRAALGLPRPALERMGMAGRDWMARDFAWKPIAEKLLATYRWVCEPDLPRPSWVVLD